MKKRQEQQNLFGFAPLSMWLHLLKDNSGVDKGFRLKMFRLLLLSVLTAPLRIYERLLYGRIISKTKIHPSPVFILGHYRSGTTHLHNLISRDPNLGYVSTFQAIAAAFSITGNGKIKADLAKTVPEKRSMDNMESSLDAPQEEEIGIASLCPYSFMHHMGFPRKALEYAEKYLTLEKISSKELRKRQEAFLLVLKKATLLSGGKRLVLKNPINTAQIPFLLDLFPDAKFIHIHRNPYEVFSSVIITGKALKDAHLFQNFEDERGIGIIFMAYKMMMQKFLADKHLIPVENFIEVSYQQLEKTPLEVIDRIYKHLGLPGLEMHRPIFESYVESLGQYKKNKPTDLAGQYVERINKEWKFAFEAWNYPLQ